MRLCCITCSACGAIYRVAESETATGSPGVKNCSACGAMLASWSDAEGVQARHAGQARVCRSRLGREGQIRKSRGGPRRTESQTPVDRITCVYAGARSRAG
jgi:hypothetical protein